MRNSGEIREIREAGREVYSLRKRDERLKGMKRQGCNMELAELLYKQLDYCRQLKAEHIRMLRNVARPVKGQVQLLTTIPGIGPISAYTLVLMLEDGYRIPNKRKLWRYCGLSLRRYESRDQGFQGASKTGNRLLKNVVMSAAISIVSQGGSNGLLSFWERDIRKNVDLKRARRNLARKIVVIAQHLLRFQQEYKDEQLKA